MRTCNKLIVCDLLIIALVCSLAQGMGQFEYREIDRAHGKAEVADIDNDGVNDIIKRGTGGEALVWYRFTKNGVFEKHILFEEKRFRGDRIAVADIDNDGYLDLATGLEEGNAYDVVWLENPSPSGNPAEPNSWKICKVGPQDGYMKDIAVADFNGDGRVDIVTRRILKRQSIFR